MGVECSRSRRCQDGKDEQQHAREDLGLERVQVAVSACALMPWPGRSHSQMPLCTAGNAPVPLGLENR